MSVRLTTAAMILMSLAAPGLAAAPALGDKRSPALQKLLDCRPVADPMQRLACYDEQAKAFDIATAKRDIVVMDKAQVAETKRGLFGFPIPHIALFDSHDDEKGDKSGRKDRAGPDDSRLETTIKALHKTAAGLWVLVLENDAVWEEVEAGREANVPKPGMAIVIKRASMGTYFASMGHGIYMRIRRVS